MATSTPIDENYRAPSEAFGRRLALGAGALGLANVLKAVLQLLMFPIMAKLLSPHEFGLYALAAPTVAFAVTLADGGLGVSLAREPEQSTLVWSTAFWTLLGTGIVLASAVSAWGVALGAITHQPRLPALLATMSVSLVLMTATVTAGARLTRRGRLDISAAADFVATCVGFGLAIICARRGAGAYSLAAQFVSGFAVRAIWINLAAFRRPTLEFRLGALRGHLVTGGTMIGQRLVDFAERLTGGALFDRLLGPAALGQYTFSTQVSRYSTEAVGNPIWAAIYVQSLRLDGAAASRLHAQLCRFMGILLLPGAILGAAASPHLVTRFLGPSWAQAGLVLRVVLPTFVASAISAQVGALLLARGRNDVVLWSSCIGSAGRVAAIVSGAWFGLAGVAFGVAAANLAYCLVLQSLAAKAIGTRPVELLAALAGPVLAGVVGASLFLLLQAKGDQSVAWLTVSLLAAMTASLAALASLDHRRLRSDFAVARGLLASRA